MGGAATDEYKKLARVMKYIHRNIGLPLIMSINKLGIIKWYVVSEFSVHKDMRIHTGGCFPIFPYYASILERTLEIKAGSTCDVFIPSTCQSMMHFLSSMILFMTQQLY